MSALLSIFRPFSLVFPRISRFKMERIIATNKLVEDQIAALKKEISLVKDQLIAKHIAELEAENTALRAEVEAKRQHLIAIETAAGRKQIPVPGQAKVAPAPVVQASSVAETPAAAPPKQEKKEAAKEKKPKPEKAPKQEKPAAEEPPVDIRRLDLRVGRIVEVSRHPDADALYLEKIDCGEPNPRTVISGLVKFVPIEEMQNRLVVVLCNLKPVKMRGITSEAMVMCASSPEKVEVLAPPPGSAPGDLVQCDGYPREPDAQMNPKKKIFETVAPDLLTNDSLEACYKGAKLQVVGKGPILAATLKNVNVK